MGAHHERRVGRHKRLALGDQAEERQRLLDRSHRVLFDELEDRPVDDQQRAEDLREVLDLVINPAHHGDRLDVVHEVDDLRRHGFGVQLPMMKS